MSTTDQYVANNAVYRMLENGNADATFPTTLTSMFSSQEIVDSMNRVQQDFLLSTGMIVARTTIAGVAGIQQYALPTDSIRPRRITWTQTLTSFNAPPNYLQASNGTIWQILMTNGGQLQTISVSSSISPNIILLTDSVLVQTWQLTVLTSGILQTVAVPPVAAPLTFLTNSPDGTTWNTGITNGLLVTTVGIPQGVTLTESLTQVDTWELDNGASTWPSDRDIPIAWYENTLAQQKIGLAKTPANNGTIGLLYVQLAATLTGFGIPLTVPDDWTPYILYGTLAELLGSDGPSFDPIRAQYCGQRYEEGVELARLVLGGQA